MVLVQLLPERGAPQAFIMFMSVIFSLSSYTLAFDPYKYPRKTLQCDAVRREPVLEQVKIDLSYVDIGDAAHEAIIMIHGWPSVWSTWSRQIEALENENYRLIVPDLRGFGYSTHPDDPKSSHTMGDLTQDLVCILDNAKAPSAVCIGHDWGSQVCYEAARMRPDLFTAVVGLVVPYIPPAGPYVSVKQFVPELPKLAYQTFFDRQTEEAAIELNKDTRRSLRTTLRTVDSPPPDDFLKSETSFMDAWKDFDEIPPIPFFTPAEEDYMVASFERQGFLYTFGFYTEENRQLSHALSHEHGNFTLPQPVLSILPTKVRSILETLLITVDNKFEKDPVADWGAAMKLLNSTAFLPDLTVKFVEGAHWIHLENPEPVNKAIKDWLRTLPSRSRRHVVDEL
ncbi:hypothetical protein D9756_001039 [Leucocoprinus leucothites]|uniref:AB hydrolase-1 domain-containing protein n=1 Tax=Leucocoprinus leucothites TaxID=201217 RepID=A0A8H5GEK1_9AGAR|nr:hypothetical protein D9756_001039 [Leucoagaricus leucothites]